MGTARQGQGSERRTGVLLVLHVCCSRCVVSKISAFDWRDMNMNSPF